MIDDGAERPAIASYLDKADGTMDEHRYIPKRDLHIGGVASGNARNDGAAEALAGFKGSRNDGGPQDWDSTEEDDMENGIFEGNSSLHETGNDDASGSHAAADRELPEHWIGDTWEGEEWDGPATRGVLADARDALTLVDDYVRSRPWHTLAVVALVSLGVGYGLAAARKR